MLLYIPYMYTYLMCERACNISFAQHFTTLLRVLIILLRKHTSFQTAQVLYLLITRLVRRKILSFHALRNVICPPVIRSQIFTESKATSTLSKFPKPVTEFTTRLPRKEETVQSFTGCLPCRLPHPPPSISHCVFRSYIEDPESLTITFWN